MDPVVIGAMDDEQWTIAVIQNRGSATAARAVPCGWTMTLDGTQTRMTSEDLRRLREQLDVIVP